MPKNHRVDLQSEIRFAEGIDVKGDDDNATKANTERRDKIVTLLKEDATRAN